MKKQIYRALFTLGDIFEKQNFFKDLKKTSVSPISIQELAAKTCSPKTTLSFTYDIRTRTYDHVSDSFYETFNTPRVDVPKFGIMFEHMTAEECERINKINEAGFMFGNKLLNQDNIYKYKVSFIFKYQLPNGEERTYLNDTYIHSTNSIGQICKVNMVQVDISNIDFFNDNVLAYTSLDSKFPSYQTTDFFKTHIEKIKPQLRLSDKERDILDLIRGGKDSYEIAEALNLSSETVKSIRKSMLHKNDRNTMHELLTDFILLEDEKNHPQLVPQP